MEYRLPALAIIVSVAVLSTAHAGRLDAGLVKVEATRNAYTGVSVVLIEIAREDRDALAEFSRSHVGRMIEIRAGDEMIASTMVAGPIENGSFQISWSDPGATDERDRLVERLNSVTRTISFVVME